MTGFKRMGLAILAALMLTAALGAQAASASPSGFEAGEYPTLVRADSTTVPYGELSAFGIKFNCRYNNFATAELTGPTSTLSASETGSGYCNRNGGGQAPIYANGCKVSLDPGAAPGYTGTFSVGPAGCGKIEIEKLWEGCDFTIEPGSGYTGSAAFSAAESETVDVVGSGSGLQITSSGPFPSCGTFVGGSEWRKTTTNGSWALGWKLSAEDELGDPVSLQLAAELPFGFYLAGKASENEAEQPRFEAESYSRAISGGGLSTFATSIGTATCAQTGLQTEVSEATEQLTLDPSFAQCTSVGSGGTKYDITVVPNGCQYTLAADNAGPPYTGTFGVACPEAKRIEYKIYEKSGAFLCSLKIGSQSGLSGVAMENVGSGVNRAVALDATIENVVWQGCGTSGTHGTLSGETTLTGVG